VFSADRGPIESPGPIWTGPLHRPVPSHRCTIDAKCWILPHLIQEPSKDEGLRLHRFRGQEVDPAHGIGVFWAGERM